MPSYGEKTTPAPPAAKKASVLAIAAVVVAFFVLVLLAVMAGNEATLEIHAPESPSCSFKANYKQRFGVGSDGKAGSWDTLVSTLILCLEPTIR
jgi:hypothetical protein